MELIETVDQTQLLYDAPHKILKMHFKGDLSDDAYKKFWTRAIDFAQQNQINRIMVDQRDVGNISFNARGWVVIHAFPRVKKDLPSNLVAAILSSERVVQKTGMQYLLKAFRTLTGYRVEVFPNQEEAAAFLQTANPMVNAEA